MIMRSNKRITTLAQTWLVVCVLTAGIDEDAAFAQTSQVDNVVWGCHSGTYIHRKMG